MGESTRHPDRVALDHRRLPDGVRRMFLRSLPYAVVYLVEPRLVIVAMAHLRRRPGYWVKRLSEL